MIDFDSYLPKYKERIKWYYDLQFPDYGTKYLNMISVYPYGETYFAYDVEKSEREPFAGILFATNLLSQVIFTYGKRFSFIRISERDFYLEQTEEKRLLFPEIVGGLLSGSNFHICPSVLPLMIFYMDGSKKFNKIYSHQDNFAARIEWTKHHTLFEDSTKWVLRDLHHNMKILCNVDITSKEQIEIEKLMWHEFNRINKELFITN
jgi:hypothetical protein